MPGFFVEGYDIDADKKNGYSHGKSLMESIFFWQAIVSTSILIPTIFLIRDKPPTPPTPSASKKRESYLKSMALLIKNKDYIFMFLSYTLLLVHLLPVV